MSRLTRSTMAGVSLLLASAAAARGQYSPVEPPAARTAPASDVRNAPDVRPESRPALPNDGGNWWDNPAAPAPGRGAAGAGNLNVAPPSVPGAPYRMPPGYGYGPGNNGYNPASDFPGPQLNDWVSANALAARARAMFHRAEDELGYTVRRVQRRFEHSKEYQDALAAEKQAYADYAAARQRALASLNDDAKYAATMKLAEELTDKIARRRAAKDISKEEILAMATLKMQYASDARQLEVAALSADGNLRPAHDRMVAASRRAADMRAQFDESVRDNPELALARRNLEDARVNLIEAQAYAYAATVSGQNALNYSYYVHRNDNGGAYGPYGGAYGNGGGYSSPYWGR